ncbi:MAG: PKD domain-containing protein [Chitinophagales bacterium]
MNRILFFAFVTFFSISNAQNACESQRYISEVFSSYDLSSGVYYGSAAPYGLASNTDLYLDVYTPAGDTINKRPVIVHKFGGAYAIGWKSQPNIPDFAEMYTNRGFVFIAIDYRLGFNILDGTSAERAVYRGIQDLRSALRFIADNATTYGIDTSNIFLTGTSAGSISSIGQTFMTEADRPASTYGTFLEPSDLGCVSCSGNNNFNNGEVKIHGIINNWGAILDTSLINIQDDPEDNVPVISFHGTNDNAVEYVEGPPFSVPIFPSLQGSFLIHERLENQGIKNKLYPLVGIGHEPQLLNPDIADTIVKHASIFLYEIMKGDTDPIFGDSTPCINDTITYTTPLEISSNYCWEVLGGNIISQNQNEITIHWNTQGTFALKVTEITSLEISKTRSLNITIGAPILANINYSSTNGLFNFNANTVNNAQYFWRFGNGDFGSGQNINYQYLDTGKYIVNLEIDNQYCKAYDTITIDSDICPVANFTFTLSDSVVNLNNTAQFYNNISWNFGDGNSSNIDVNSHQYAQEGTFIVQQIVNNNYCIDTFEQIISISFCSSADFDVITNGLDIELSNFSHNSNAHFWNFGDGTTSGLFEPNHNYNTSGNYSIELIVYDTNLCSDTMLKTIFVEEKISTINSNYNKALEIYPNPINEFLFIKNNNNVEEIVLKNILGETLRKINIYEETINLKSYSKGLYFISFKLNNQVYTKKIIKQ